MEPRDVPPVNTRYRTIKTPIPNPATLSVIQELARYEARSMHGQLPVVWDRAENAQVEDESGNRWIDFTSTIFMTNAGHAAPQIIEAITRQLQKPLVHSYTWPHRTRLELLEALAAFCPAPLQKSFLVSAGTEATECVLKLMRLAGMKRAPDKRVVIAWEGAMHGRTMGAQLLGGTPEARAWCAHDPEVVHLPFPSDFDETLAVADAEKLWGRHLEMLAARSIDGRRVTGLLFESYQGWSAAFYPRGYVQAAVAWAGRHDALVAFDEIQAGFWRTGEAFAFQHYGVLPDLIACGKGMSSSVPLAGVIGRPEVLDIPEVGSMSSTHSANPVACAAGLANLQILSNPEFIAGVRRKGARMQTRLREMRRRFSGDINAISGRGMVAAILTSGERRAEVASAACEKAMQRGLLLVHTGRESIKIGPPLSIPETMLDEGLDVLEECLADAIQSQR